MKSNEVIILRIYHYNKNISLLLIIPAYNLYYYLAPFVTIYHQWRDFQPVFLSQAGQQELDVDAAALHRDIEVRSQRNPQ